MNETGARNGHPRKRAAPVCCDKYRAQRQADSVNSVMIASPRSHDAITSGNRRVHEAPTDRRLSVRKGSPHITEEPQSVYTCHFLDCQRLIGSAFSLRIVVSEKGFRVMGLEPRQL